VVIRRNQVLLVRRANPPDAGRWGFPGGKIDAGEPITTAAVREIWEETAVTARAVDVFTAVDAFDHNEAGELRRHFVLIAVLCRWVEGEPIAGDDAIEARWFDLEGLERMNLAMSFGVLDVARRAWALLRSAPAESRQ
jgi:8-oxo-dGTP diphosphatase